MRAYGVPVGWWWLGAILSAWALLMFLLYALWTAVGAVL